MGPRRVRPEQRRVIKLRKGRQQQRALVREVPVSGRASDIGSLGGLLDRRGDPLGEQLTSGLDQGAACALSLAPPALELIWD